LGTEALLKVTLKRQNPHHCWWGFAFLVDPPGLEPGTKGLWGQTSKENR